MRVRTLATTIGTGLTATALVLSGLVGGSVTAGAQTNPYERGPAPTASALRARSGDTEAPRVRAA